MRCPLIAGLLLTAASPTLAQSGIMYIAHSQLDGEVAPGEAIRFELSMDWTVVNQILWIDGHIRGTPDIGRIITSYGPATPPDYRPQNWGGLCTQGTLVGATIESFQVAFTPSFYGGGFMVPSPSKWPLYGTFLSWDWAVPDVSEVTVVTFTFEASQTELGGVWGAPSYYNPIPALRLPISIVTAPIVIDPGDRFCAADLTATTVPGEPGYGVPDGILASDDFFYYLVRFAAGDPKSDLTRTNMFGSPGYGVPDGVVNNDDFFRYLTLYSLGC